MWRWVAVLALAIGVSLLLASAGWVSASELAPETGTQAAPEGAIWQPQPGLTWQWQLSGKVNTSVDVDVYDIDMFDNDAHARAEAPRPG